MIEEDNDNEVDKKTELQDRNQVYKHEWKRRIWSNDPG